MYKVSETDNLKMNRLEQQVQTVCQAHNCDDLFKHLVAVAQAAKALAKQVGVDQNKAYIAGLLHDIGGIFPNEERIDKAREFKLSLFKEELALPMIIHQKLSQVLAKQVFEIVDDAILSAICCHTTLKANPSLLDETVFLADKIKWDGAGQPPYLADLLVALSISLSEGCLFYIEYILSHDIKVLHPWLLAAKASLSDEVANK
ncbi:bis(5'-nucleosyl)-tetraphosphatase (symmetrical) YqeK [Pseudolactococcus carnosus]|uniref:bis(5'-nucleosyl)-tetraphosphatase (symmetrical) YqeK n=1 Tax=Pseudolactococcus carnosus TaxID=2749961 RepID=UPI001FBBF6AA|nr:bis(5'-nucleosyl)-tetraphosphatase (symmetrical) YqeK [Lactococcus carnosus]